MKIKQGIFACILLVKVTYSLYVPLDVFSQLRNKSSIEHQVLDSTKIGSGLEAVAPEVKQLISIFENMTKQTESDLISMFLSQDRTLALLSLQFWVYLLKILFVGNSNSILDILDGLEVEDLIYGFAHSKGVGDSFWTNLNNSADFTKDSTIPQRTPVSLPKERNGFTLSFQSYEEPKPGKDNFYGQDMSYETLNKWIDDYGLSASSLRDYLETYLFAGDHSWAAEIAVQSPENGQETKSRSDLKERLALLGKNIQLTLAKTPFVMHSSNEEDNVSDTDFNRDDNQHFEAATHKPFTFENSYSDDEEGYESNSNDGDKVTLEKRSLEDPLDFNPLVYAFSRLDSDHEADINAENEDLKLMQSKHRIFENDEIVQPISASSVQESSPRSKDYRQVVYDAVTTEPHLAKREEDCVPVTWYNVFHHSVFGKHKFCHV